ncbi:MAG: sugar phosphate isomerase/epimerase [Phycisphaerae bacterium]|nr:sugar phosphate isomerase/epimerase [Phycisphaerae bacterium]
MDENTLNRRGFIKGAIGTAVVASVARAAVTQAAESTGSRRALRLGAPVFDLPKDADPETVALAHRKLGYRAAYCPAVDVKDAARVRETAEAYAKHDVVIAEVGRWCNLLDADAEKRRTNLAQVTEGLALAEAIGAGCCVNIAGSYNEEVWYGPHPKNLSKAFFDAAVENARTIIDAVKPKRAQFGYEMMGWSLPDSPDAYLRMIRAVDREAFAAHVDICNMVNSPQRFYDNTALINECFDKLGPWIVSCHAKDLMWLPEMNVHFKEVPPGAGSIDYTTYLRRLAAMDRDIPLMVEHCANPAEYDQARKHLLALGPKVGVRFESAPAES